MDTSTDILETLRSGRITLKGEFLWGSNYTFLADVEYAGMAISAVYKPSRGERLLWDFPAATLAHREVAAFMVSDALRWNLVPPTVFRISGPLGPGSLQYFVDHDPEYHYFNFIEEDRQRLRPVVLFDVVINNADRKGSHILRGSNGRLWLIDHGVCFHVEDKLRTVIWEFSGQTIPVELANDINRFCHNLKSVKGVPTSLAKDFLNYISHAELDAMVTRIDRLVSTDRFPMPALDRRVIPWPQL